jgi:putative FmdB family regulatory protein
MPTYDYQCQKCGKTFEFFQSMKDEPLKTCPKDLCEQKPRGRGRVRRQLGTGAGIIFKGSGFYTTDYRSKGYHEAAKKESGTAKDSAAKPSAAGSAPKEQSAKPEKKTAKPKE